ncbi:MAG TPA: PDZ domain-containing protein [Candidatus Saccharimonadales bacterium]|nr:PDZ domain-containing protein [Candidatus Saccharimonadales bacterium]
MTTRVSVLARVLFVAAILFAMTAAAPPAKADTRLLQMPDIGKSNIVFVYAGDIWVADRDGSNPRRLTVHPAQETEPRLSPDGRWIAFTGNYDGNPDVYVVPIDGGQPRRLTFHPGVDHAIGWSPDGTKVLFDSSRDLTYERGGAMFLVSTKGGFPERLPMPYAWDAHFSPDGGRIAYQLFPSGYSGISGWRHYRGGTTPPIWLFDMKSHDIERVPHEGANDSHPMWVGDKVYFVSDRAGTSNVFVYEKGAVRQLTHLKDWDVRWANATSDAIIFEAGGRLHVLDLASGKERALEIEIHPDLPDARPHWVAAAETITDAGISPTGTRAVFAARGEILTVPAEKGDIRNLTRSPGSHERNPLWSPDGKQIAWLSDASGEYKLIIGPQEGIGETKTIDLGPPDYYFLLDWSPDGSKIIYSHSGLNLFSIATSGEGKPEVIDKSEAQLFGRGIEVAFSPDSRWLAYTKVIANRFRVLMLHDFESGENHQITEGLGEVAAPVFSHDGKYLYFTASTNIGPAKNGLDMTTQERPVRRGIYAAVLAADGKSPLPLESDDEKAKAEDKKDEKKGPDMAADKGDAEEAGKKGEDKEAKKDEKEATKIDVEGLTSRIVALPVAERNYDSLAVSKSGDLFYVERQQPGVSEEPPGSEPRAVNTLQQFDMKKRRQETFIDGVAGFSMSRDGSKMLVSLPHRSWSIVGTDKAPQGGGKPLPLQAARVQVVPREEWVQIFNEAWRVYRDFFWDANMHGADWKAVHDKYRPLVDYVGCREDLDDILVQMVAEVISSHARAAGGDTVHAEGAPVGLLGADYAVENGYYRIKRIYTGESWNPFLKAPLAEPGLGVKEGDYIVAVNGAPVKGNDNIYSFFEGTVGKQTVIAVNDKASSDGSHEVTVEPIGDERMLRRWKWIEDNRRKVEKATNGRVGYVYLPNTAGQGFEYFNRFYFSQIDKDAIILDERGNGGGQAANYIIEVVTRKYLSSWKNRYGLMFRTPMGAIFGPKVMLIDQFAGSGGDWMPYMFRYAGAGELIGTRTWGGLIGGGPIVPLMDGGFLNVPVFRFLDPHGKWSVENEGVSPDIEVEQIPKEVIDGHDPQLERAIAVIQEKLKTYTPPFPAQAPPIPTPAKQ